VLTDPRAMVAEIKALLQAQGEASANLKAKLDEIEELLQASSRQVRPEPGDARLPGGQVV
jgi:hypothetical protein